MIFQDRKHAGQLLAEKLEKYKKVNPMILALPRGGVPVAAEIAKVLDSSLDVLIVRKVGAPFQPELAVGAICEDDEPIWNNPILYRLGLGPDDLGRSLSREREKIKNQISRFRKSRNFSSVVNQTVIVVDDGLATGATMLAAVRYLKKKGASKIIVAAPVAATSSTLKIKSKVAEIVILDERDDLMSVGQWYEDFSQVTDEEVAKLLKKLAVQSKPYSINPEVV